MVHDTWIHDTKVCCGVEFVEWNSLFYYLHIWARYELLYSCLGDSGYPLEPWLLPPVPGVFPGSSPEGTFNRVHRSTRSIVERCIGMLKNRFRCLQRYRTLHYDPAKATNIVTVCAILHNICIHCNLPEPEPLSRLDDCDDGGSYSEDNQRTTGVPPSLRDKGHEVRLKKMKELVERRRH